MTVYNLQVLDLLVMLLKSSMTNNEERINVFSATFDVMHTYLLGNSRKNKAFFLQYLRFFQHQFNAEVNTKSRSNSSDCTSQWLVHLKTCFLFT